MATKLIASYFALSLVVEIWLQDKVQVLTFTLKGCLFLPAALCLFAIVRAPLLPTPTKPWHITILSA